MGGLGHGMPQVMGNSPVGETREERERGDGVRFR